MQSTRYTLFVIASLVAVTPFSMEAYLPALPAIAAELGADIVQVNYTISVFLIGSAIGELLGGSISDQIGRKLNVAMGLSVFSIASAAIAFCNDINTLLLLRLVQAFGGGFATIVAIPALRDIFDPETTAKKIPIVVAATMIAPMFAPVIGSVLLIWSWRWIFIFLAVAGMAVLLLFNTHIHARSGNWKNLSLRTTIAQYGRVLRFQSHGRHIAILYILIQGFAAGIFLCFLTNAAWIYLDNYSVSSFILPLYFIIHTGAMVAGNLLIAVMHKTLDVRTVIRTGSRLQITIMVVLFLVTYNNGLSLLAFNFLLVPLILGTTMVNASLRALVLAYFEYLSGSVNSLLSLARFTFGAATGFLSGLLFDNTMLPIISIMLACSLILTFIIECTLPKYTLAEISRFERPPGV